jgi:uncharacterized membrane protein YjjB (DUF3815 family)
MNIQPMVILQDVFFSALAAMGFAMLFNVPKNALLWCMAGGALGHALRTTLVGLFPDSLVFNTLVACVCVGFFAQYCANRLQMPMTIFQLTAAVTMIPGVFAYQSMLGAMALAGVTVASISDPLTHFTHNFAMTTFLLGAIAFGITIPSLIFNRIKPVV